MAISNKIIGCVKKLVLVLRKEIIASYQEGSSIHPPWMKQTMISRRCRFLVLQRGMKRNVPGVQESLFLFERDDLGVNSRCGSNLTNPMAHQPQTNATNSVESGSVDG